MLLSIFTDSDTINVVLTCKTYLNSRSSARYMYEKYLIEAGLTADQAKIYYLLINGGKMLAGRLSIMSGTKRSLTYNILEQLIALGLAKKEELPHKTTRYIAEHPSKIKEILEQKQKNLKNAELSFGQILSSLSSEYNLAQNKPNVRFYEGMDGVKKILADSLTAKETILSFSDGQSVDKLIYDLNKWYVEERKKKGIAKNIIMPDTQANREKFTGYYQDVTKIKFVKNDLENGDLFSTIVQIYDNKVSFQTLTEQNQIGIIIEDRNIYLAQKMVFSSLWRTASEIALTKPLTDDDIVGLV